MGRLILIQLFLSKIVLEVCIQALQLPLTISLFLRVFPFSLLWLRTLLLRLYQTHESRGVLDDSVALALLLSLEPFPRPFSHHAVLAL